MKSRTLLIMIFFLLYGCNEKSLYGKYVLANCVNVYGSIKLNSDYSYEQKIYNIEKKLFLQIVDDIELKAII